MVFDADHNIAEDPTFQTTSEVDSKAYSEQSATMHMPLFPLPEQ